MERTIRVTGKGILSVKPDTIRLRITQEGVRKEYAAAVKESADQKKDLNDALAELGFKKEDLKTLYFNVDSEYESYQDKNNAWKRRLKGYKFVHRMKLEFPADNALLGRLLYAIAHVPGEPEFSIEHTVADSEAVKNELLANAVADSKAKAAVLASAAGVSLGAIQLIDYSWGEVDFVSRPMDDMRLMSAMSMMEDCAAGSYEMDIEADDIDVTDTVTVVWEIEN